MSTKKSTREKRERNARNFEERYAGGGGFGLPFLMGTVLVVGLLTAGGLKWASAAMTQGEVAPQTARNWAHIVASEKIEDVEHVEESHYRSSSDTHWLSFSTKNYHVLNGFLGTARLCRGLTPPGLEKETVGSGVLLDYATLPAGEVEEKLLIPRPSAEISVVECKNVKAAGDHFEVDGKTVAILEDLGRKKGS